MAQYTFNKPYSAKVTVGGAVGIMPKTFNKGDVVEGTPKGGGIEIRIAPHSQWNEGEPSNVSYQEFLIVPTEYLTIRTNTGSVHDGSGLQLHQNNTLFTQRNVMVGLAIIVLLLLITAE